MRKYSILMVVVLGLIAAPAEAGHDAGTKFRPAVTGTRGVVASISKLASDVGVDVLNRGGNAIDAAVAMVFAVGVARPDYGGIGGDGFLVYRGADGPSAALDFRETAPAAMTANALKDPGMHFDKNACDMPTGGSGHRLIGVPGVVAGMDAALDRYGSGKFTLGQLITSGGESATPYAYELARDGVPVGFELFFWLTCDRNRLEYYPATREIYGPKQQNDKLVQTDYAKSLLFIAENGADAFYENAEFPDPTTGVMRPSIAQQIAADSVAAEDAAKRNPVLLANGPRWGGASNDKGFLTVQDFADYEPVWRTPLTSTYRDHRIITMPPASSGGIAAVEILNLLEGFPLGSNAQDISLEANADTSWAQSSANHLHLLAEAQKIAWADRARYAADPDFRYDFDGDGDTEPIPTKKLTSKTYADGRRGEIDMNTANNYQPGADASTHTNHLSVMDEEGNAVAVTTSVGGPFGSAVVAPGTGFLLTNQLEDFTVTGPGGVGTPPEAANAPGPRKRPRSSQTPTIVLKDGKPVLVVGGAGGPLIPMGVVQAIVNAVDFDLDIAHAIDAARIDARALCNPFDPRCSLVSIEGGTGCYNGQTWSDTCVSEGSANQRVPDAVLSELTARGHTVRDAGEYAGLPNIQAVGLNLATGLREAATDQRNGTKDAREQGAVRQ